MIGAWIGASCGQKYGTRIPTCATYHMGECDYCGQETAVTEPRDYGYPALPEKGNDDAE